MHRHQREKSANFFCTWKEFWEQARMMKCEPVWEYEFEKARHNSVWRDEQLNHNSWKGVFTPIPCLSAPQSTITELRELLHQDVTVSAGMAARPLQVKKQRHTSKKQDKWEGGVEGYSQRHLERQRHEERDRQCRKQEMIALLRI